MDTVQSVRARETNLQVYFSPLFPVNAKMSNRGYFGIGIYSPKSMGNIGSLWRTAHILGASFVFTIGRKYKHQPTDTMKTPKHIPLHHYKTSEIFLSSLPLDCSLIGIEMIDKAKSLRNFTHPERAIYLLGSEKLGLPKKLLDECNHVVRLHGKMSMNVSIAGSIVLYHRVGLN